MSVQIDHLCSFLEKSPTSWHCVQAIKDRLCAQGFQILQEQEPWQLNRGGKYVVSRGGSIAAFCLPKEVPTQIRLIAAHTDSPAFKLKPNPIYTKNGMHFFSVEAYGAPIYHSWLNRDLALAGRCFVQDSLGNIKQELVFLQDMPFMIPELAIHLHREVNEKGPNVNVQEHLLPFFAQTNTTPSLEEILQQHLSFHSLLSFDLFVVPLCKPRLLGLKKDMLASYRIDNCASVFAAIEALTTYQDSPLLPICLFWDHEEIGSTSWEGAQSTFSEDIFRRVRRFYSLPKEDFLIVKQNSLCLSMDMAHALHPLHPQKYDLNNAPHLGKGIVFKQHANHKYATCAESLQKAIRIAKNAQIPFQHFASRSDITCGSTVGPGISALLGIQTIDLGCPQLSMHSCRELMATQDYLDSIAFLTQAFKPF